MVGQYFVRRRLPCEEEVPLGRVPPSTRPGRGVPPIRVHLQRFTPTKSALHPPKKRLPGRGTDLPRTDRVHQPRYLTLLAGCPSHRTAPHLPLPPVLDDQVAGWRPPARRKWSRPHDVTSTLIDGLTGLLLLPLSFPTWNFPPPSHLFNLPQLCLSLSLFFPSPPSSRLRLRLSPDLLSVKKRPAHRLQLPVRG